MATQYTDILKLAKPTAGELDGTWGDVVNNNITSMIEEAIAGRAVVNTWTTNSHTLSEANGLTSEARCAMLEIDDDGSGNPTAAATVICPSETKTYIVNNSCGQTATIKTSAGTGVAVPNGTTMLVFCDGTDVVQGVNNFNSLYIDGVEVTASPAELNLLDGVTATTAELNILDGVTATTAELNILDGVTANTAELNILDGVTATTAEINYLDGVTSSIQIQLNAKADSGDVTPSEWGSITGTLSDQTDLQSALNNKLEDGDAVDSLDINGGTIDGAVIGGTAPAAGTFTTFTSTGIDDNATETAITIDSFEDVEIVKQYADLKFNGETASATISTTGGPTGGFRFYNSDSLSGLVLQNSGKVSLFGSNGDVASPDISIDTDGSVSFSVIKIGSWTLSDSGGKLVFNNGANRFSIDASGNIIADNNITAYGSP